VVLKRVCELLTIYYYTFAVLSKFMAVVREMDSPSFWIE